MTNENMLVTFSTALADAAEAAGASVVRVEARRRMPASGVSFAPGLIVTASHVVEREDEIRIGLPGGGTAQAALAGRDPGSDLAVLRLVENQDLSLARPAAEPVRVGQFTLALGRPGSDGIQASLGVISAFGGPVHTGHGGMLEQYIRTDAIPYPGFSGGPLIDFAGNIIGINTSGLARGMAVTIPTGYAWQIAAALGEHGYLRRGYLGIRSQPVEIPLAQQQTLGRSQQHGLLLVGIEEDSPAQHAGLIIGDILIAIEDRPLNDPDELLARLATAAGQDLPLQVLRGGRPETITVTIGERKHH